MKEALPSIGWRPAPPPPPEAAHLDYAASLTLPTLPATPPRSATPNQGLPTSTSSEPPQLSLPTPAPLMLYGQPCFQHPHRKCRRHNLITCTRKTSCLRSPSNPVDHTAHRFNMAPFPHGPPCPHRPPWMSASKHTKDSAVVRPSDIPLWMTSQTSSMPHQ